MHPMNGDVFKYAGIFLLAVLMMGAVAGTWARVFRLTIETWSNRTGEDR